MLRNRLERLQRELQASNESQPADGKARLEREFTYYGKLTDLKALDGAKSKEAQEQWSVRTEISDDRLYAGETRVRKSVKDGGAPTYVLTNKCFKTTDNGKMEAEVEISADFFEQFKKIASQGMIKTRYTFPREDGLVWEVDIYQTREGKTAAWCKIDLEVPDDREAPRDFPVPLTDVIEGDHRKRTEAERLKVREILDKVFLIPNAFPKQKEEAA